MFSCEIRDPYLNHIGSESYQTKEGCQNIHNNIKARTANINNGSKFFSIIFLFFDKVRPSTKKGNIKSIFQELTIGIRHITGNVKKQINTEIGNLYRKSILT